MKKLNIAELLKDCPKGMELYSPIFGKVYLDKIRPHLAIVVTNDKKQDDFKEGFLYDGRYGMNGECMLFPSKGKLTWKGFQRPFKDGDIIVDTLGGIHIMQNSTTSYCYFDRLGILSTTETTCIRVERLATEEEKQKLFNAIKANGYKWNSETKTLEKLIEPKFKVGDRIKKEKKIASELLNYNNPNNTPKSYAVGLKDGKVIECGVNNEIAMSKNKPLFKAGDVVKLKGCPDENLFWIVMDVVKDGYIFNDGKKYSFDDQHHYEKSNREVINTQPSKMKNVLAELLDHINNTSKEELEKEFKEIEEWSHVGPTIEEFMDFCNKVNKKPKYPKTYEECCKVFDFCGDYFLTTYQPECMINKEVYGILQQVNSLTQLLICKSAYWKIAGEQMGIGKPWEPNWDDENEYKYGLFRLRNIIYKDSTSIIPTLLIFPTIEMRDAFYDNFKDLIEQCKELL